MQVEKMSPLGKEELIETLLSQNGELTETIANLRRIVQESNQTIETLQETIEGLHKTIAGLNQSIKELTEKQSKNSRNSSKPPSSDGLQKPSPKSLRSPSGKKVGGQKGHPPGTLSIAAEPDDVIEHEPSACLGCPRSSVCGGSVGETRTVIDAVVTVNVTAHKSLVRDCPLYGVRRKGEFPEGIKAAIQYGENLQALAVSLNTIGAVSIQRTHEILSSVFSIPLSTGTVSAMVRRCAQALSGTKETIRQKMTEAAVAHCDETGIRVEGKTMWVHTASNGGYTHLSVDGKRGKEGMDAAKVLPEFSGIAVHDCWAPYWKYPNICHALCCAHLLRELVGIEENYPQQLWATAFKRLLIEMKAAKEEAVEKGQGQLNEDRLKAFELRYDQILARAYEANPQVEAEGNKRGRKKKGKVLALAERLAVRKASVILFIKNFAVPFDNNQAERDIRMIKTKSKVSGCFRSMQGAKDYLKIMSYVGTAKKQKINPYEAIRQAILGTPEFIFAGES